MDARLYVRGEAVHRLDGHDSIHLALGALIDELPARLADSEPDDEIVLSIYVGPHDFANDSGFALEEHQSVLLAEQRCTLNVVFMADNSGALAVAPSCRSARFDALHSSPGPGNLLGVVVDGGARRVWAALGAGAVFAVAGSAVGYAVGTRSDYDEVQKYCLVSIESAPARRLQVGDLINSGGSGCSPDEAAYCWSFDDPNPTRC